MQYKVWLLGYVYVGDSKQYQPRWRTSAAQEDKLSEILLVEGNQDTRFLSG